MSGMEVRAWILLGVLLLTIFILVYLYLRRKWIFASLLFATVVYTGGVPGWHLRIDAWGVDFTFGELPTPAYVVIGIACIFFGIFQIMAIAGDRQDEGVTTHGSAFILTEHLGKDRPLEDVARDEDLTKKEAVRRLIKAAQIADSFLDDEHHDV